MGIILTFLKRRKRNNARSMCCRQVYDNKNCSFYKHDMCEQKICVYLFRYNTKDKVSDMLLCLRDFLCCSMTNELPIVHHAICFQLSVTLEIENEPETRTDFI